MASRIDRDDDMSWYYLCYITDFKDKDTKTMYVKYVSQVEGITEINYLEQRRWTRCKSHVQHLNVRQKEENRKHVLQRRWSGFVSLTI